MFKTKILNKTRKIIMSSKRKFILIGAGVGTVLLLLATFTVLHLRDSGNKEMESKSEVSKSDKAITLEAIKVDDKPAESTEKSGESVSTAKVSNVESSIPDVTDKSTVAGSSTTDNAEHGHAPHEIPSDKHDDHTNVNPTTSERVAAVRTHIVDTSDPAVHSINSAVPSEPATADHALESITSNPVSHIVNSSEPAVLTTESTTIKPVVHTSDATTSAAMHVSDVTTSPESHSANSTSTSQPLRFNKITMLGPELEGSYTVGSWLFGSKQTVKAGGFDISFINEADSTPKDYRVFYFACGVASPVTELEATLKRDPDRLYELPEVFGSLEEFKVDNTTVYKTKVVDENSHEPKGLTAEKLEMHIRYSGLKHLFFAGMDNKELVPWHMRSVYFIVPKSDDYQLDKIGVPVKEIVSKVLDTRIIGPERNWSFKYIVRTVEVENLFRTRGLSALRIDFVNDNGVVKEESPDSNIWIIDEDARFNREYTDKELFYNSVNYEKLFKDILQTETEDGLKVLYSNGANIKGHIGRMLKEMKENGLESAFDYHYQQKGIFFMETSVLLIGDKTKLKEYADFKKVTA